MYKEMGVPKIWVILDGVLQSECSAGFHLRVLFDEVTDTLNQLKEVFRSLEKVPLPFDLQVQLKK